jgi:hypothetical protein
LDELNKQAKDMWVPGIFVAINEQTIGFQGQSGMKLRISYKQEGAASNVMLFAITATHSRFISATGRHRTLTTSTSIWTSCRPIVKLCG